MEASEHYCGMIREGETNLGAHVTTAKFNSTQQ